MGVEEREGGQALEAMAVVLVVADVVVVVV